MSDWTKIYNIRAGRKAKTENGHVFAKSKPAPEYINITSELWWGRVMSRDDDNLAQSIILTVVS